MRHAAADYDLGITLPWGFAGAHGNQPVDLEGEYVPNVEHVVFKNMPHCTDFLVAAENFWSAGNAGAAFQPTLKIKVTPK
jgi:hypothetical protein